MVYLKYLTHHLQHFGTIEVDNAKELIPWTKFIHHFLHTISNELVIIHFPAFHMARAIKCITNTHCMMSAMHNFIHK